MAPNKSGGITAGNQPLIRGAKGPVEELSKEEAVGLVREFVGATRAFRLARYSSHVYELLVLRQFKEHGAYKQLGHTWESFCKDVLGRARRTVDDDLQSLDALGQEFMELADQLNIGRRALHGLRRLPDDARPRILESGELEVGDERVPLDEDHREQVKELLEDIVAGQERLRGELEKGRDQLQALEEDKAALEERIREMEYAAELPEGVFQHDRRWMTVIETLLKINNEIAHEEEGTEPDRVQRYYVIVQEHLRDVLEHTSGFRRDDGLPEGYDPEVAAEVAREMED